MKTYRGFTLIEILVAMSIIALISSVIFASLSTARKKARDSQRIQSARQIALALEQYEHTNDTYKVSGAGLTTNPGTGYAAKTGDGYSTSILSALKADGYMTSDSLIDPVFGLDNFYIGLCTSTNAYNVFVKLEQEEYNQSTSTITNACGGTDALNAGFSFVAATTGGGSGISTEGGILENETGGETEGGGGGGPSCTGTIVGTDGLTYGLIVAEDNKCWLDRNLGATQVATAYNDHLAYGDLYQWGRGADGHEKITRTSRSSATAVNGSTATLATTATPGNNLFITASSTPYDWVNPQINTLWQGVFGTNNPCPPGFRLPTGGPGGEWANLVSAAGITDPNTAYSSSLKLTLAGFRRNSNASLDFVGGDGLYWSSSVSGTNAYFFYFTSHGVYLMTNQNRANAYSVRCLKD